MIPTLVVAALDAFEDCPGLAAVFVTFFHVALPVQKVVAALGACLIVVAVL